MATVPRRSEFATQRRSARFAPLLIHLIPLGLFLIFILITIRTGRKLALPLVQRLDSSWQNDAPLLTTNQPDLHASDFSAFTPEVQRWGSLILEWSVASGLPPELIATVIQIESCGDPAAQSSAGAQGLFQVMPFHFKAGEDPLAPTVNARAGLAYLERSYQLSEADLTLTFAGYNGGHAVIQWNPSEWPEETQRYAAWGAGIMDDVQSQDLPSPTLSAWLEAGGASLCRQAAQRSIATR